MREKGRDLGKGRALGSCKMPHPPRPLGSWDLSLHFLRALVFAISRIAHPTDPTLVPPDNHPSPHSYGGSTRIQRLPSSYQGLQTCPRLIYLTENHDEGL